MPTLPPVDTLPSLPAEERAKILDLLFEPSTSLHTLSLPITTSQAYPTYDDLIASIGVQLVDLAESASTSDTKWLESILSSHPRLGEKKVDSEMSRLEQAKMVAASAGKAGDDEGKKDEARILGELNEEYEKAFPGLRYVVFVNARSRPVIFEDMRRRIQRADIKAERVEAIKVRPCSISFLVVSDEASRLC
jgi:2-oxo-4-hydroxy-4-carboxy--5-ureidoimidazoline (OHCU) decarboxylase